MLRSIAVRAIECASQPANSSTNSMGIRQTTHCSFRSQRAKQAGNPSKYNQSTAAQCAPFYLAILIGRILLDLFAIVASLPIYDNTLFYALCHDPVLLRRVPMRRAVFRALRRGSSAACLQHGNRRGALFHRSDGASSQAIRRGPAVSRSARPQAR